MVVKDVSSAIAKLNKAYRARLHSRGYTITSLIEANKLNYPTLHSVYNSKHYYTIKDEVPAGAINELRELEVQISGIVASKGVNGEGAATSFIHWYYGTQYDATKIIQSPLGEAIKSILEYTTRKRISKEAMMKVYYSGGLAFRIKNTISQEYTDRLIHKYGKGLTEDSIRLFVVCLISTFGLQLRKTSLHNINIRTKANIDSLGTFVLAINEIRLFYLLNYDINDKEQWPFNGETAREFLYRKLKAVLPTEKQIQKINMIGLSDFKGIDSTIVAYVQLLCLLAEEDIRQVSLAKKSRK